MIRKWAGVGLALMAWGAADVSAQDDQIVAMDPKGECAPLYPSLAELDAAGGETS